MYDLELRKEIYRLIQSNSLEEEVWITLSMMKVRDAIIEKGGTKILLQPDALHPNIIRQGMEIVIDEMAGRIVERYKGCN